MQKIPYYVAQEMQRVNVLLLTLKASSILFLLSECLENTNEKLIVEMIKEAIGKFGVTKNHVLMEMLKYDENKQVAGRILSPNYLHNMFPVCFFSGGNML